MEETQRNTERKRQMRMELWKRHREKKKGEYQ